MEQFVALLRGINVGGKHKVPMTDLKSVLEQMGFTGIKTLLNTGNVIFETVEQDSNTLEKGISGKLQSTFGFPIPVLVRTSEEIGNLLATDPFQSITVTKDIRLYVSFLKNPPPPDFLLPYVSIDESFRIIGIIGMSVMSVLDVSKIKTTDAMNVLEKIFGRDITTRNWNTVEKIGKILGIS